jgi:hypothetical protein
MTPPTLLQLPPFQSTRPPSPLTAASARRVYLALRGAVIRRCRRSTGLDPARYASKATFPIPLLSSHLLGSRLSSYSTEKTGGGVKWMGVFEVRRALPRAIFLGADRVLPIQPPNENPRLTACTAWDCMPALRTHITSIVRTLLLSSIFPYDLVGSPSSLASPRGIHTYRNPRRVFSYRLVLSAPCRTCDTSQPRHTPA